MGDEVGMLDFRGRGDRGVGKLDLSEMIDREI